MDPNYNRKVLGHLRTYSGLVDIKAWGDSKFGGRFDESTKGAVVEIKDKGIGLPNRFEVKATSSGRQFYDPKPKIVRGKGATLDDAIRRMDWKALL